MKKNIIILFFTTPLEQTVCNDGVFWSDEGVSGAVMADADMLWQIWDLHKMFFVF